MRGYFPESVSDYTKEQCEEYLATHPNGLRSDSVRDRLKKLSNQKAENHKCNPTENSDANRHQSVSTKDSGHKVNSSYQESKSSTGSSNSRINKTEESNVVAIIGKIFYFLVVLSVVTKCIVY